jgi:glycosyltransferase involved in cell wall biosynthesis
VDSARQPDPAPRVAYLITSSGLGGAEMEVFHLAGAFRRRGWEVAVISMLPLEPPISNLRATGVRTYSLGMRQGVPDPRGLLRLVRVLRSWRPDVLHAHMVHANLLARISRLLVRTPVVISTMHSENEGAPWRYLAYRVTHRLSDLTTTVSHTALTEATRRRAAPAGSIALVPNGLDTAAYARDERIRAETRRALGLRDSFTWLSVGRLTAAKGHVDMIRAFTQVLPAHSAATLLIAGTGQLEGEIARLPAALGVEGSVRLLGRRLDVPALMQAADAFVMTSHWEGLPMALLEAGASGLPVVATDVGGSRDAVLDGISGYLTPIRDPGATALAMSRLMELSTSEQQALGAAGRQHVREMFDIEAVAATWVRLYRGPPTDRRQR